MTSFDYQTQTTWLQSQGFDTDDSGYFDNVRGLNDGYNTRKKWFINDDNTLYEGTRIFEGKLMQPLAFSSVPVPPGQYH